MDVAELRAALIGSGLPSPHIRDSVGSTNDVARALAESGAPDGTVVWAEEQTAGRGRRDRSWHSPAHSGIWMSSVWTLDVPRERWGWIPLVAGLAVRDAVAAHGVRAELKWPNDVVVNTNQPRKIAGILAEVVNGGSNVVIGTGLNVSSAPVIGATFMAECGGDTDRVRLSAALAAALKRRVEQWRTDPQSLHAQYTDACSTIGQQVSVELERERLVGQAVRIDADGHLIVCETSGNLRMVTAGDVVHATIST